MSWPLVKIGDIFEVSSSKRVLQKDWRKEGVPFYRAREVVLLSKHGEVDNDLFIDESMYETFKEKYGVPQEGDLLVTAVGTLGQTYAVKKHDRFYFKDASVIMFRPKVSVDISYIQYAIRSPEVQRFIQNSDGATVGTYTISRAKETLIPLPPLDEQKRIAAILDKADAIRQKRKQAIDLADEFLRSVFLDMFGDPVTNPKGWEVKACKDLFKRITVGIVVKPSSYYVESGVPALRSLNIGCYGIRSENLVYVSKSDNESILAKTRVYEGDLVIVRSGQPGKTAVVCKEFDGVNAIDILIATPKEELIEPQFFAFFMNSDGGKKIVLAEQRGQVQKHFNVGSLNSTAIPLPPLSLQRTFAEIAATVYGKYQTNKATEFNEIFNSISQKAFSGQL
ncbi:restriction endonuclease subunit S [Vibrio cholerae]|uniref:restriction endonuclease subunit S n=1 Tax=Vibrio cholerae TaxID=666 RepID=UPI001A1F9ACE|nr:restriction endonuclease subunit S [Vibrio cholerae]EGR3959081.1 restriction endonuclease subunit S [Vibrio cholerae]EGR4168195.1 restriction endonuclease subunit S [Vibrio cholerae]EKF9443164.1 restriction endonuclease subunit S [Vibrio cholerae]EKI0759322.1 restriction endonuclease subunit S [Vibrio cholerae]ELM0314758.1 restriction endonuclease subunit S [Vibrio cholerae]